MHYRTTLHLIGSILTITGLFMVPSLLAGLFYQESQAISMLISTGLTILIGQSLKGRREIKRIYLQEAFFVVTMSWILVSIAGSLPYTLSRICCLTNGFFESISGFTTTGATIFLYPEDLPKTILLWRSTTQWLGGIGIILLYLALLPEIEGGSLLFYARGPQLNSSHLPKSIKKMAVKLSIIYLLLTTILFLFLITIGRLVPFQALLHSMTTIATGGFASHRDSAGFFQGGAQYSIILFMILSGISFNNLSLLYSRSRRMILQDRELLLYLSILLFTSSILTIHLYNTLYPSLLKSFRLALFQTSSLLSTTGFSTIDYDGWSPFAKAILLLLMLLGGCSGSTAGGIKIVRIYRLGEEVFREIKRIIGREERRDRERNHTTLSFFFLYLLLLSIFTVALTYQGLDLVSSFTAAAASLGNIGPGLHLVGPKNSYAQLDSTSKILLCLAMLLGRLEIFTLFAFSLLLFKPS